MGEKPKICGVLKRKIISQPVSVGSLQPVAACVVQVSVVSKAVVLSHL